MRASTRYFPRLVPGSFRWFRPVLLALTVVFSLSCLHLMSRPSRELREPKYYRRDTEPFFPPSRDHSSDACAGFPTELLKDIQVVIKTGIGEIHKAEANLNTTSSCLTNAIVVADAERQIGKHRVINILADLPASYRDSDPVLDTYWKEREAAERGEKVDFSHDGWKMDRYKFLPMVDRAYKMRPDAAWYIFTEADVYIFWDTMFRLISQYNPDDKLYLGSAVGGAERTSFAYGGASFIISQGLMKVLIGDGEPSLAAQYQHLAVRDCCGDAVLAYAIRRKTGVRMKGLYPMFSGEEINRLRMDAEKWCIPLISVHRADPKVMEPLWHWERTRPYTEVGQRFAIAHQETNIPWQKPLIYSDTLYYTHMFLRNETKRTGWDNRSDVKPPSSKAHQSPEQCAKVCHHDRKCFQWSYSKSRCQLGYYLEMGSSVDDKEGFISGWDMEKVMAHGFSGEGIMNHACNETTWRAPNQKPA